MLRKSQFSGNFKKRMQKHFGEVQKLSKTGQRFDSYARHFAEIFSNFKNISPDLQRNSINCSILWEGNPISAVKTFATPICTLCAKERLETLKQSKKNPGSSINSCHEICGACRHNPKFHRCVKADPSTDESLEDERVPTEKVTTEFDLCRPCRTDV